MRTVHLPAGPCSRLPQDSDAAGLLDVMTIKCCLMYYCPRLAALADDADMMARISRHLEAAGDKPVVESELKVLLGFSGTPGHRSWRRIR